MDISNIFQFLNEAQREAVGARAGPVLVLAGAGSGKTRVLTYRIAYLIEEHGVSPFSLLAVTFTNKAAREMRARVEELLGTPVGGMWIGTFHGLAHRLLRYHFEAAGLPQAFQIIDAADQLRLVKRVLKELELDEAFPEPRQVQRYINAQKEEGRRPERIADGEDQQLRTLKRLYTHYEALCQRLGLVDFAELLLRTCELFERNESIRHRYQERFRHLLVDEFQDTNAIQYRWLRLIAVHRDIMAVGDDDQSIYGWRGAKVENILNFEKDYPGALTVRLEQNYRSSGHILDAANTVIANNQGRFGKSLWTSSGAGQRVQIYHAYSSWDEADFVIARIKQWVSDGNQRHSAAILYRSNAQSRAFEERLFNAAIPYRVYGGLRFFDRAEVKDALAYLHLVANRAADPAFERVVNHPPRGIGAKTTDAIRDAARTSGESLWDAARQLLKENQLASRATNALRGFLQLIADLAQKAAHLGLGEQVEVVVEGSRLLDHYRKEKGERGEERIENLEELTTAARGFNPDTSEQEETDTLSGFLAHAALEAGDGQADEWQDAVQLMSLHSAKGLEFPLVFLTGMEEGLFPHQRSVGTPERLEEERRLCYVGMTRAMKQLYLSCAEVRQLHGREHHPQPSRFLAELPEDSIAHLRPRRKALGTYAARTTTAARHQQHLHRLRSEIDTGGAGDTRGAATPVARAATAALPEALVNTAATGVALGARVRHARFGDGVVLNLEGHGAQTRVQVNFENTGSKWLLLAVARLAPI